METFTSTAHAAEPFQNFFCKDSSLEQLQLANETLQTENKRLLSEMDELRTQLEQYKLVSQSFEKRVLDLQKEVKSKDDEIASLQKADSGFQNSANHVRHDGSKDRSCEDGGEPEQFRKLFIGGLSYSTTDISLREYFCQFGDLLDCVVMKDNTTKRSRGFGFVVYSRVSMVDAAQAARPHVVDGREVETKRAVPKGEPLHRENQVRVRKIFVGGLKETTDDAILSGYFSQFGHVDHVDLIEDRATKRLRGFAYVTFNDYDPVDKAVLQKYHTIDGRRCEVKKALSKLEMRNLKDGAAVAGQGMPWPVGGCNQAGGNMCNVGPMNYGAACNVGGYGANCNFSGAGKCGMGMNSGNQMGWNQCGWNNRCAGGASGNWNNQWCGDNFHNFAGPEQFSGVNFHTNMDAGGMWCRDHSHRGGCHGGSAAGDTRLSHHNTHQPATSPNGFVSD